MEAADQAQAFGSKRKQALLVTLCSSDAASVPTFLVPFLLGAWAASPPSPTSAAFLALSFAFFLAFFFCAADISCEHADSIMRGRAHGAMQPVFWDSSARGLPPRQKPLLGQLQGTRSISQQAAVSRAHWSTTTAR